jgi:hypothetical protein
MWSRSYAHHCGRRAAPTTSAGIAGLSCRVQGASHLCRQSTQNDVKCHAILLVMSIAVLNRIPKGHEPPASPVNCEQIPILIVVLT